MPKTTWTPDKIEKLKAELATKSQEEVAELYGITMAGLKTLVYRLQLPRSEFLPYERARSFNAWTVEQDEEMRRLFPNHSNKEIGRRIGRTTGAVYQRAYALGLRKPEEVRKAFRVRPSFRPNLPSTTASSQPDRKWKHQVGDKVLRRDAAGRGYWHIKIADTPGINPDNNWRYLHHHLWIQEFGSIPAGKRIGFIDGNSENCVLENLYVLGTVPGPGSREREYRRQNHRLKTSKTSVSGGTETASTVLTCNDPNIADVDLKTSLEERKKRLIAEVQASAQAPPPPKPEAAVAAAAKVLGKPVASPASAPKPPPEKPAKEPKTKPDRAARKKENKPAVPAAATSPVVSAPPPVPTAVAAKPPAGAASSAPARGGRKKPKLTPVAPASSTTVHRQGELPTRTTWYDVRFVEDTDLSEELPGWQRAFWTGQHWYIPSLGLRPTPDQVAKWRELVR